MSEDTGICGICGLDPVDYEEVGIGLTVVNMCAECYEEYIIRKLEKMAETKPCGK